MSERRARDWPRIIEALRAKADRTNFPDEAEALRARADRLECRHIPPAPPRQRIPTPVGDLFFDGLGEHLAAHAARGGQWSEVIITVHGHNPFAGGTNTGTDVRTTTVEWTVDLG